jgi:hypothetical protein
MINRENAITTKHKSVKITPSHMHLLAIVFPVSKLKLEIP